MAAAFARHAASIFIPRPISSVPITRSNSITTVPLFLMSQSFQSPKNTLVLSLAKKYPAMGKTIVALARQVLRVGG